MFIKVCGIKNYQEIEWAIELGYSAIGIVVYKKSKRFVDYDKAKKLAQFAKSKILTVAVSLKKEDIYQIKDYFDYYQCYEICNLENLIFATEKLPEKSLNFKYLLYDASKGSGIYKKIPSWVNNFKEKLIIAGGLNTDNVKNIINKYNPFGIDVSSGVEVNGKKNFNKMKQFIEIIN